MPAIRNRILEVDGKRQAAEDFDTAIKKVSFFCCPKDDEMSDHLLTFTSEATFRGWARSQGILDRYDRGQEMVEEARKQFKRANKQEIEELQSAEFEGRRSESTSS